MWHIHPTEQWIDQVVTFMSEQQLSFEDSKFMIAFFSSMDNEFVEYFKRNQNRISSFSGRSFHIFTPLIYEGNTIPDEHWRYMRNEFKALGIPVGIDPTFVFFSLDARDRFEPSFFAGFSCSSFDGFQNKIKTVIETCIETDDMCLLTRNLSEIFRSENILTYDRVDRQLKRTISKAITKSKSSHPSRKDKDAFVKASDDEESIQLASILFLAADPTNASRLRLGEEFREIQEKLQLAQLRDKFKLELPQLSVRPADITQALLDSQPQIVHFSGHGDSTGALCFENQIGQIQLVPHDALSALFEQFSNQVSCVILNACYSEIQAKAIAEHIEYVVGMNQAIGDKAAIAFAIGFYQALGAGRSIQEAYKLGCVQIRLQGIPEHLTPVLIKKEQKQATT
jgi:CHAT domain